MTVAPDIQLVAGVHAELERRTRAAGRKPQEGGEWIVYLCPYHDDREPSFEVHKVDGNGHCFSCGSDPSALALARHLGICEAEAPPDGAMSDADALALLRKRGLSPKTIGHFKIEPLGHVYRYPVTGPDGKQAAIRYKRIRPGGDERKYSWPKKEKDSRRFPLYVTDWAEVHELVWLPEGDADVWAAREIGLPAVSLLYGAGNKGDGQGFDILAQRIKAAVIIGDNDAAGEAGATKWARELEVRGVNVGIAHLPHEVNGRAVKDLTDLLVACGDAKAASDYVHEQVPIEWRAAPASADGGNGVGVTGDNGASRPFEAQTLDALLSEPDADLEAVIGDGGEGAILTRDGKGFVAGPTGVGKTNLLLRLSRSLCEGAPFLDLPIPQPRRVLYVMLEGSRRGLRRRLRKVWEGADTDARERFTLAFITLNLANEDDLGRLEGLLAEVRPEILIIDPLRNAHPWDENLSHEAARLTGILDALIDRYGVALILAHHDRKRPPFVRRDAGTDRVRGSTALTGWLQFCLSLDPDPRTPDLLVAEWTKTRDAEIALPPMVLEFDRDTLDFLPSDRAPGGKVSDDAILNAIAGNGGAYRGPDLVAAFVQGCGAGERTVRERLRALVKEGALVEYIAPADKKTGAKTYALPDNEGQES